jgi:YVTN family beta-propeller protein
MYKIIKLSFLSIFIAIFSAAAFCSGVNYSVRSKISLAGTQGWDYLTDDPASARLYVTRGDHVVVIDTSKNSVIGEIPGTAGVHGIAAADEFSAGFTSNGKSNTVTIFDLKTLKVKGEIKTGENPDAIIYDGFSKKVFTFNGKSKDSTVIDAGTGKVLGTIPLGGKPEYACADGAGKVYVNIENTSEVAEIDAVRLKVLRRFSIKPGVEPTGIAIDIKDHILFSGCHNKMMTILDTISGKLLALVPIGAGVDACAFDPGRALAFASNGMDGTLTVIKVLEKGKFDIAQTAATQKSARTMALDTITHKIYLSAASFGKPVVQTKGGKPERPPVIEGTFAVLVVR